MRLQKAQTHKVTGKSELNDRSVAVPARLVDGQGSAFNRVEMGLRIPEAEQQLVARKNPNGSVVKRMMRAKGARRCFELGRNLARQHRSRGRSTFNGSGCAGEHVRLPLRYSDYAADRQQSVAADTAHKRAGNFNCSSVRARDAPKDAWAILLGSLWRD
jgi:hypothetical protein